MKNNLKVEENLINLIAKIGEKITIRRSIFFDKKGGENYSYVHSAVENNVGKIISIIKLNNSSKEKNKELGLKLAMHIAASSPIAINSNGIQKSILDKELEIIKEELTNSGKDEKMVEKISKGKLNKFISDNTLLNQIWIMDPKKKFLILLRKMSLKEK